MWLFIGYMHAAVSTVIFPCSKIWLFSLRFGCESVCVVRSVEDALHGITML